MNWSEAAKDLYESTFNTGTLDSLDAVWKRELVALYVLDWEINSGHYLQFIVNHGQEMIEYAFQGLTNIGAKQSAKLIDDCQILIEEHFPMKGFRDVDRSLLLPNEIIGRDGRVKKKAGSILPANIVSRIRELSLQYLEYQDDIGSLAQKYFNRVSKQ